MEDITNVSSRLEVDEGDDEAESAAIRHDK
jgi:hypothetical protein